MATANSSAAPWRIGVVLFRLFLAAVMTVSGRGMATAGPQQTLALYAKDPDTWKIRPGGASGTLEFDGQSGRFTFTARQLQPDNGYLLVRYAGGLPIADLLAEGVTDGRGGLRLSGTWRDWTGKIWLVTARDLVATAGRVRPAAWHPEEYLFEEKVLGVPCTCTTK